MKYLVISEYAERREEMRSVLRQLDRRAHMQDAKEWLQVDGILRHEPRDLVFADLSGANDQREITLLLERHPTIVVAALSDDLDANTTVSLLRLGLRAVIPRNLDWRAMIRALELVLLGGHYVSPHALHLHTSKSSPGSVMQAAERMLPYRRRLIDSTALSPRQQQIMRLVHMGSTNKSIARALGISEGTVKIHLASVFKMLGASNRAAAVAIYNGWLFDQVQGVPAGVTTSMPANLPPIGNDEGMMAADSVAIDEPDH